MNDKVIFIGKVIKLVVNLISREICCCSKFQEDFLIHFLWEGTVAHGGKGDLGYLRLSLFQNKVWAR